MSVRPDWRAERSSFRGHGHGTVGRSIRQRRVAPPSAMDRINRTRSYDSSAEMSGRPTPLSSKVTFFGGIVLPDSAATPDGPRSSFTLRREERPRTPPAHNTMAPVGVGTPGDEPEGLGWKPARRWPELIDGKALRHPLRRRHGSPINLLCSRDGGSKLLSNRGVASSSSDSSSLHPR